ncbi:MAG: hypothetical protein JSS09_04505, partial [Verrucomicrobia bacterium]|nr:hypothetical protein [Verrucomicrobiota bacterium]
PSVHNHRASLEDLCTRKIVKLKVTRQRLCSCINESNTQSCSQCSGTGMKSEVRHIGFMQQVLQRPCESCEGRGKIYNHCNDCNKGTIQDHKVFELFLNPELENGYRYMFHNEGNHNKGCDPGDFIVVIEHIPHSAFRVDNKKLTFHHKITLVEALCGHTIHLTHPSGELITVQSNEVINPTSKHVVKGKGLTTDDDLVIEYTIEFPEKLTEEVKKQLNSLLHTN